MCVHGVCAYGMAFIVACIPMWYVRMLFVHGVCAYGMAFIVTCTPMWYVRMLCCACGMALLVAGEVIAVCCRARSELSSIQTHT